MQDALLAMGEQRFDDAQEHQAASEHPALLTPRQWVMTNGQHEPCPGAVGSPGLAQEPWQHQRCGASAAELLEQGWAAAAATPQLLPAARQTRQTG